MSYLLIFETKDAFTRFDEEAKQNTLHIRVQQRRGRKCTTTVEGLSDDLDLKMITRALKRKFNCTGTVVDDAKFGKVIKVTGDQRANIFQFLIDENIYSTEQVVVH